MPNTQCRIGFQPVSFPHGAGPLSGSSHLIGSKDFPDIMEPKKADSDGCVPWTGETGWKPILHCASATSPWALRTHPPLNTLFLQAACHAENPMIGVGTKLALPLPPNRT